MSDPTDEINQYLVDKLVSLSFSGSRGDGSGAVDLANPPQSAQWPFFSSDLTITGIGERELVIQKHQFDENGTVTVVGKDIVKRTFEGKVVVIFNTQDDSIFTQLITQLAANCSEESDFSGYDIELLKYTGSNPIITFSSTTPVQYALECFFTARFKLVESETNRPVFSGLEIIENYKV